MWRFLHFLVKSSNSQLFNIYNYIGPYQQYSNTYNYIQSQRHLFWPIYFRLV